MIKKILPIIIIFLLFSFSVNALCGDYICEKTETSDNCCIDCGCAYGEECNENTCEKSLSFFSFSPEISIFLLILIIIFGAFVIGYGFNIVLEAHKKTEEHLELKKIQKTNKSDIREKLTPGYIKEGIIDAIKQGKSVKEIKKELDCKGIDPDLADELLTEVIDTLIAKSEQGLLSVDWDPRIVECVFKEVMRKPRHHRKRLHHQSKHIRYKEGTIKTLTKPESVKEETINEVDKYIGIALARGYSREDIKKKLVKEGWHPEEIDNILDDIIKRKH